MATYLHGSESGRTTLAGRTWLTTDLGYAAGYAGEGGHVLAVEIPADTLRTLDLTSIIVDDETDPDTGELAELLADAGVDAAQLGWGEMHQRIPALEGAIRAAGYDAVAIREWTYGIGGCISLCVFDLPETAGRVLDLTEDEA